MPTQASVRAVVLDEWPMVRVGVSKVLADAHVRVVADAADGPSALTALRTHQPDLFVVGRHPGSQADLIGRALDVVTGLRCIALLTSPTPDEVRPVLAAGAHGVVSRAVDPAELRDVVRRVLAGDRVVSPVLLPKLFGNTVGAPEAGAAGVSGGAGESGAAGTQWARDQPSDPEGSNPALTGREREIMRLLGAGRSNAEIATALFVSAATVKTHLAHIYGKLGVRSRYEAIGRAVALGLLD